MKHYNATDKRLFELHAEVCKTFSSPKRLEILTLLRDGERSFGEMLDTMGIPKANLSQHLALLRERGVVVSRREGQSVYFRVSNPKIIQACDLMREVLCERLAEGGRLAAVAELSPGHREPSLVGRAPVKERTSQ